MTGLLTCIRKAGKALDGGDATAIRGFYEDSVRDGMSAEEAGRAAIEDYVTSLETELNGAVEQARAQGADVSAYAQGVTPFADRGFGRDVPAQPGPVRFRLEDEGNVDEEPKSPFSVAHKMAVTVEDQANYNPGLGKRLLDTARNMEAKSIPAFLGAIPRRYLGDFITRGRMPTIAAHMQTAAEMDGRRNALLVEDEELAKRWNKWTTQNKAEGAMLGELMHAATLSGADPAEPYVPHKNPARMTEDDKIIDARRRTSHRLLQEFWNKLPAEGQAFYREVRDRYAARRQMVLRALEQRIGSSKAEEAVKGSLVDQLRAQFEAGRVQGPYFPLMRFGDYWASAKDKETGEVIAFAKFEKLGEQRAWMNEMREAYEVDGGRKQKNDVVTKQLDPGFAAKVTDLVRGVDPRLADDIWQMYLANLPEMSMRKAFMHRKGRLGFSSDAIRAFGHQMFHGAHQISKLEHMGVMQDQIDRIYEEARAIEKQAARNGEKDIDAQWASPLADELLRRFEWAQNPKGSALASKATSLGFVWFLGASVASGAVNLTQTPMVALPVLGAEFNSLGAVAELAKGFSLWAGSRGNITDRLRGDERRAMEDAGRIATFEKTQAADLAQLADGAPDYSSKGRKAMELVSWVFHKTESANRQVTFLAAYRLARMRGDSYEDAVSLAHKLTYDSHFDYNNVNRPRYMQGDVAKVLFLFRQYSLNMTYRLTRDFRDGVLRNPALSKADRNKAAQRFGGIIGMTYLMAGATGLPMFWLAESVLNSMLGDDDDPFDTVAAVRTHLVEQYGETAATAIMQGGWDALTGMTISNRVSLNNLWVRDAPENAEGKDLAMHYVGELAGPLPKAFVVDPLVAAQEFGDGYADRGMEKLMPKFAKDAMKTIRYITQGLTNRRGDVLIPKEEFTSRELFYQLIGFVPERVTRQYAENRAKMDKQTAILDRRVSVMDRLFHAAHADDQEGINEAIGMISKFNAANPRKAIDASAIIGSAKSRNRYSAQSVRGASLDPDLRYLHEEIRFSNPQNEESEGE